METGNAQYLSNIEETYDFKILKGTDPEIVKVSGGKAYLFFKRAFDIVAAIVICTPKVRHFWGVYFYG